MKLFSLPLLLHLAVFLVVVVAAAQDKTRQYQDLTFNPYLILQVSNKASLQEIKKAYRRAAIKRKSFTEFY